MEIQLLFLNGFSEIKTLHLLADFLHLSQLVKKTFLTVGCRKQVCCTQGLEKGKKYLLQSACIWGKQTDRVWTCSCTNSQERRVGMNGETFTVASSTRQKQEGPLAGWSDDFSFDYSPSKERGRKGSVSPTARRAKACSSHAPVPGELPPDIQNTIIFHKSSFSLLLL